MDSEVQKALQVIQEHSTQRGDSFDIGTESNPNTQVGQPQIIEILSNPRQLAELGLTDHQVKNLRSLMVGGGTGGIHRMLSQSLGDGPAAVIGALVSAWATKKIFK